MKSKLKVIIPVLVAILLVAAAVAFIVIKKPFEKKEEVLTEKRVSTGDMAYVSGNSVYYIADINAGKDSAVKVKDIEIADEVTYNVAGLVIDDIKGYLYFFDEIKEKGKGTLCRIDTSKITTDEAANTAAVEVVDYDIYLASVTPYIKGVLYVSKDNRLFWYDGTNEPDSITNDIYRYVVYEDLDRFTYMNMSGELFIAKLSTGDIVMKVDSNVLNVYNWNPDFMVYSKSLDARSNQEDYDDSNDGHFMLYSASETDGVVELTMNCGALYGIMEDKKIITFLSTDKKVTNLYDCVVDVDMEAAVAPVADDYLKDADLADANAVLGKNYSSSSDLVSQEELKLYAYGERAFYTVETEDKTYAYDSDLDQWYLFDVENYLQDESNFFTLYFEKDRVDELREALKAQTIVSTNNSICRYKNGKVETVAEDVYEVTFSGTYSFIYDKKYLHDIEDEDKVNIAEVDNADSFYYTVVDMIEEIDYTEYLGTIDGNKIESSKLMPDGQDNVESLSYNPADKTLVIATLDDAGENNKLITYRVKDEEFVSVDDISENGLIWGIKDGRIYYLDNLKDGAGDLYIYVGGTKTLLAKGVVYGKALMPDDGTVWGYSSIDAETQKFSFAIFDENGIKTKIGDDISAFAWIGDNKLFYFVDNNIYYYHDETSDLLAEDVTCYAYVNSETCTTI